MQGALSPALRSQELLQVQSHSRTLELLLNSRHFSRWLCITQKWSYSQIQSFQGLFSSRFRAARKDSPNNELACCSNSKCYFPSSLFQSLRRVRSELQAICTSDIDYFNQIIMQSEVTLYLNAKCFDTCIDTFKHKLLTPTEKECMKICLKNMRGLYIEYSNGRANYEQSIKDALTK